MTEAPQPAAATQIDSRLIDLAFPVQTVTRFCNIENRLIRYERVCHVRKNVLLGTTACLNCPYCKGHVRAVSEQGTPEKYVFAGFLRLQKKVVPLHHKTKRLLYERVNVTHQATKRSRV